jgi:hypothetical protein
MQHDLQLQHDLERQRQLQQQPKQISEATRASRNAKKQDDKEKIDWPSELSIHLIEVRCRVLADR